jgi:hypothetical protein
MPKYEVWYRRDAGYIVIDADNTKDAISIAENMITKEFDSKFHETDTTDIYPYEYDELETSIVQENNVHK